MIYFEGTYSHTFPAANRARSEFTCCR
jgi:hypothetical protein